MQKLNKLKQNKNKHPFSLAEQNGSLWSTQTSLKNK